MWSQLLGAYAVAAPLVAAQSDIPISGSLQSILDKAGSNPLYQYPTQLTQGIIPKAVHSHNDYWRPVPFYSALAIGAVSIEADVWLYDGTLYVGHEQSALTKSRTFDSLYVQPILDVLHHENPNSSFVSGATKNGVYDTSSSQTLYLFVDLKTDGATTWPAVIKALAPLRNAGYLTTYNGTAVVSGPVTVIGTGNTPLNQVQGVSPRDYFWDAPLPTLGTTFSNITKDVSPIASTAFSAQFGSVRNQALNSTQTELLDSQIATAHAKGIAVRYWDQPGWPVGTRNAVWRILWDAGADLINVDDLEAVANFWEESG
ncbi:PLC-like phosphodiesterase [Truncatella angustata]|uniref:PLC-like phosphodiesterase n=1 Tax=Truncatella angustata TaxID=152316 RepID=A0A9P8RIK8_9PEZI|nr:PLC-like phosphodiesterase [Truncatella angustata]KAH6643375.1 PLC-like phosphodiesterase [Truncatella angustata]